jgi:hypothetical protein
MNVDLNDLALRARTALAEARTVTLSIQGGGRVPADAPNVLLHDNNGEPTFLCDPGSPVTPAAQEGASAQLSIVGRIDRARELDGFTVIVSGRLARVGVYRVDGVPVDVIRLLPDAITVAEEPADDTRLRHFVVPLHLYRRAVPSTLPGCAARLVRHANRAHQHQLRSYVAHRVARAVDDVAGVTLAELGPYGADLHWVGSDGAHTLPVAFSAPARTPGELARRLRAELTGT